MPTPISHAAVGFFFRGSQWTQQRARIALILGLALLSHACLDALRLEGSALSVIGGGPFRPNSASGRAVQGVEGGRIFQRQVRRKRQEIPDEDQRP